MKPFRFSLQSLRVLREQKEQLAQKHYTETLQTCEAAAAQVKHASDELAACWTTLCNKLSDGVNATELLRTRAWCNVLEMRLKERATALEAARREVDAVWREMMLATRDREALDRFHDKRRRTYDQETQRAEQKNLDELALTAAVRNAGAAKFRPARMGAA
jgi:flagellar export protein FliJ